MKWPEQVPKEIIMGILVPLPKPQGPLGNLRPVVLLAILRKILAVCMIGRTSDKIKKKIHVTQAGISGWKKLNRACFYMKTFS